MGKAISLTDTPSASDRLELLAKETEAAKVKAEAEEKAKADAKDQKKENKKGNKDEDGKLPRRKVTLYLDLDHILLMDEIRTKRLKAGAKLSEVEKSRLMREALELLGKQEGL